MYFLYLSWSSSDAVPSAVFFLFLRRWSRVFKNRIFRDLTVGSGSGFFSRVGSTWSEIGNLIYLRNLFEFFSTTAASNLILRTDLL